MKYLLALIGVVAITACSAPKPKLAPGEEPFYKMRHDNDGLIPLKGSEIDSLFTGKRFRNIDGLWFWVFGLNGVSDITAADKTWEITGQRYSIEGDKLCRSLGDAYPCVDIYAVDGVYRFAKEDSDALEPWAIVPFSQR